MLDENATTTLAESVTAGTAALRRDATTSIEDRVRWRLAVCFFLHIVGVATVAQVYPRVILDYFQDNDGKASRFNGWLTLVSSILQLIAIPTLSGASDVVGRRAILGNSMALTFLSTLALALTPNSIVAVCVCQLVSGVTSVSLPVSQAVMVDLSRWGGAAGGGEVTHGLGFISAVFGLAVTVGPVIGGSLSETRGGMACLLTSSMNLLALFSLTFYGWDETAPTAYVGDGGTVEAVVGAHINSRGQGRREAGVDGRFHAGSTWRVVNPFSVLKVLLESILLTEMAGVLLCFCFSLYVSIVYYNYLDFRYDWTALDISFFYSTNGVLLALTSGVIIRFLVPKWLSMEQGMMLGMLLQGIMQVFYGLAPRGWMVFPVQLATLLQFITEPCIQGLMATQVDADRQGSLQGAVQSLRILAAGIAGVAYAQIFSLGVSNGMEETVGFLVPGLPFFCSAGFSLCGLVVAWFALRKLDRDAPKTSLNSFDAVAEQGDVAGAGPHTTPTGWTTPAEDYGDRRNAESAERETLAEEALAPVEDATVSGVAALRPKDLGDDEYSAVGASEPRGDVLQTGLGDEEDKAISYMISVPLLPRGSVVQSDQFLC